jgi:NADPH2:quinone reductase
MRVVRIREPGGPEVLEIVERPEPFLPPSHLRVRVHAAGVNRADLLQRMGFYPAPPGVVPDVPGLEYAGEVVELGAGATRFAVGDRIYGVVAGGAYAEQVVVHEREAARVPEGLSWPEAASVPEAFATAWDALTTRGGVTPGSRVLVHAVGSGVGTAALQLARALGCHVTGTSRTPDKLERAKELGLSEGVVSADLAAMRRDLERISPEGFDVIIDLVGGAFASENVGLAALRGRIVVVGLTAGIRAEIDLARLLARRATIVGTTLRARPIEEKILVATQLDRDVGRLFAEKRLRPVLETTMPLADAPKAHELLASNTTFGKVILEV